MGWLIFGLLIIAVLLIASALQGNNAKVERPRRDPSTPEVQLEGNEPELIPEDIRWPYRKRRIMSPIEQSLFWKLNSALPEHVILAQVQLSQLIRVEKGHNHNLWWNRINQMSADFVVCNKDSSIVAVIELDDASHRRRDRQKADAKKDKTLADAGIQLVRWQARSLPTEAEIKAAFIPSLETQ
ncbi:MAG: DUF2726 domain-containing protein [Thermodesulfovibrionales bacterium]|jgi:very-short-patch-repair endonuclease